MTRTRKLKILVIILGTFFRSTFTSGAQALADQAFSKLTTNLLERHYINLGEHLEQIQSVARSSGHEKDVLKLLKNKVEESEVRYKKRFDPTKLKIAALCGSASLIAAGAYYTVYKIWHQPLNQSFDLICKQLKNNFSVSVDVASISENKQSWGEWVTVIHKHINVDIPSNATPAQREKITEQAHQLLMLKKKMLRREKWLEEPLSVLSLISGMMAGFFIYEGLFPKHKEYLKQYTFLKEEIEQALKNLVQQ